MTGMCEECDAASMLLPSIESFLQRWRLPKVHYLFYEYFYKAVIKDSVWNDRIDAPRPGPDDSKARPKESTRMMRAKSNLM
jgi:hypothetical protein